MNLALAVASLALFLASLWILRMARRSLDEAEARLARCSTYLDEAQRHYELSADLNRVYMRRAPSMSSKEITR